MALTSLTHYIAYTGDGSTVAFSVPFIFYAQADLYVVVQTISTGAVSVKTLTTHYTVSPTTMVCGDGQTGGTLTMLTAPTSLERLYIARVPAKTQNAVYVEGGRFPAKTHEQALDLISMIQQVNSVLPDPYLYPNRVLVNNAGGTGVTVGPIAVANKALIYDGSGVLITSTDDYVNQAANAAASASAASSSASAASTSASAASTSASAASTSATAAAASATAASASAAIVGPNQGTTTTLLHGNASGNPSYSAVSLTADVTGILPVAHGGTGLATLTAHSIQVGNGTSTPTQLGLGTATTILHGAASGDPTWSAVSLTADITGTLNHANGGTDNTHFSVAGPTGDHVYTFPDAACTILTSNAAVTVAQGGTGLATLTIHALYVGNGTTAPTALAVGATNTLLHGNTGADPSFSAVVEADITLANNTTNNVSSSAHGFAPITPGDATTFMSGASPATYIRPNRFITFGGGQQAQNSTAYIGNVLAATENQADIIMPFACVVRTLYALTDVNVGGSGQTAVFTVRKNGVDTAITVTISTGQRTANTTGSVSFAAGDILTVKVALSATSGALWVRASVGYTD